MADLREERTKLRAKINMLWNKADVDLPSICRQVDRAYSKYRPNASPVKAPMPPPPKCIICHDLGYIHLEHFRIRLCICETARKIIEDASWKERA